MSYLTSDMHFGTLECIGRNGHGLECGMEWNSKMLSQLMKFNEK